MFLRSSFFYVKSQIATPLVSKIGGGSVVGAVGVQNNRRDTRFCFSRRSRNNNLIREGGVLKDETEHKILFLLLVLKTKPSWGCWVG